MAIIKSKHDAPLHFPNGMTLQPKSAIKIARWAVVSGADTVKAWLAADIIEVEETAEDDAELEPAAATAQVSIPDGWEDLSWNERRTLASHLSSEPIRSSEEANGAIRAELDRREEAERRA